jgi:hypothetical protein
LADKKPCIVERDGNRLVNLKLKKSAITNNFEIIIGFIKKLSEYHRKDFDDWFEDFLDSYCNNEPDRFKIMDSNIPIIKDFVNKYIDHLGIDFSKFAYESKIKSNTIVFSKEEIESICKASCYLKVYAIIFNSENICLDEEAHKEIYNKILEDKLSNITGKILDKVIEKINKYKKTDRSMWEFLEKTQNKTIDYYITDIFISIMSNFLVRCEVDRDPITFFVACIDKTIEFIFKSPYKQTVEYVDSPNFGNSQIGDSYDLLRIGFCDCDIRKLKKAASDYVFKNVADSKQEEIIRSRLKSLKYISPVCRSLAFPILSEITRIPDEYISAICPGPYDKKSNSLLSYVYYNYDVITYEDAALLSVYAHYLLSSVFEDEYQNLFNLLDYAPIEPVPSTSKDKLGNLYRLSEVLEEVTNCFGVKTSWNKSFIHDCLICRIEEISKFKYVNILNGEEMSDESLDKVEADVIEFFPRCSDKQFGKKLEQIEVLMFKDF